MPLVYHTVMVICCHGDIICSISYSVMCKNDGGLYLENFPILIIILPSGACVPWSPQNQPEIT